MILEYAWIRELSGPKTVGVRGADLVEAGLRNGMPSADIIQVIGIRWSCTEEGFGK
jgi:hypothetical protein